ncbi:MAG TPA: glycoside hydrolase family 57 protein, partial [Bryobacteraceae bacterium]|nr:glycoside hydrolase family 57 protein [Bryobacteraceae bacterium]
DPFLRVALKPAEELTQAESEFLLQYFFQANPSRMIYRYKRYGELFDLWQSSGRSFARARRMFDVSALRDLQVLSQLAWFDEEYHARDSVVRELTRKGRDFSLSDQRDLGSKQIEAIGNVMPAYRDFAASGQIEVSTTPFYHPILPLLCDTSIAEQSHPYVPLPARFTYPQDAQEQLVRARTFMESRTGIAPQGLWPSEGSVSDQALHLAAETGFRWFATDNGVLARTLGVPADPQTTCKPYLWKQGEHQMHGLFRDHYLSDLIGFVYSRMGAEEAADHFMARIHENCDPILRRGADALMPVFLDGENAWEHYEESGRPFLRALYRRLTDDAAITATTISEALAAMPAREIDHIWPGSWINANFDVWIGAEEDNRAWDLLLKARQTYDEVVNGPQAAQVPSANRQLAFEELLIAEGSDWNWWYGPEHESANRPDFDQLYRSHLANVYSALGLRPPEELSRPLLKVSVKEYHIPPSGPVKPVLDGEISSYFEWMGAGVYRLDQRTGAMHGQRFLVQEVHYGSDGSNLYLRLDFMESAMLDASNSELRITVDPQSESGAALRTVPLNGSAEGVECRCGRVCEVRFSLTGLNVPVGHNVRFQLSVWQAGLPLEALPPQGWIEFSSAEPTDMYY